MTENFCTRFSQDNIRYHRLALASLFIWGWSRILKKMEIKIKLCCLLQRGGEGLFPKNEFDERSISPTQLS
jgi:hypothetical protein